MTTALVSQSGAGHNLLKSSLLILSIDTLIIGPVSSSPHPSTSPPTYNDSINTNQKMGIFSSLSSPTPAQPFEPTSPAHPDNLASATKQQTSPTSSSLTSSITAKTEEKVKPCCVCKDEKSARDKCMLFSQADDPQEDCKGMVQKYRECMRGHGFNIA